jgi:hypothetical protein
MTRFSIYEIGRGCLAEEDVWLIEAARSEDEADIRADEEGSRRGCPEGGRAEDPRPLRPGGREGDASLRPVQSRAERR